MHGTGTALGDPIEVGAAIAVYSSGRGQLPLAMAASKAWVGHAEPGAGVAGLLFAQQTAIHSQTLPLLHLRAVNPYAASTLEAYSNTNATVLLPKQFGPASCEGREERAIGVSAFAFQGTNAHAVVQLYVGKAEDKLHACVWKRKRYYVVPEPHVLLQTASVFKAVGTPLLGRVTLQADLSAPQLAYMWDHAVMGKCIFPGMIENILELWCMMHTTSL